MTATNRYDISATRIAQVARRPKIDLRPRSAGNAALRALLPDSTAKSRCCPLVDGRMLALLMRIPIPDRETAGMRPLRCPCTVIHFGTHCGFSALERSTRMP
jgi:hypothetical protein